jgi:hypothetical protein
MQNADRESIRHQASMRQTNADELEILRTLKRNLDLDLGLARVTVPKHDRLGPSSTSYFRRLVAIVAMIVTLRFIQPIE